MKDEAYEKAYSRVMNDEAGKAELEVLIAWAEREIKEWELFREICQEQLKGK